MSLLNDIILSNVYGLFYYADQEKMRLNFTKTPHISILLSHLNV